MRNPAVPRPGWPHLGAVSRCRVWQLSTRGGFLRLVKDKFRIPESQEIRSHGLEVGWKDLAVHLSNLDVEMPNEDIMVFFVADVGHLPVV